MKNSISKDKPPTNEILFLENKALSLRIDSIRSTTKSKSGHPTSCLSAADLVAAIFFHELRYDLQNPKNPNNDRFILSKGHAIPVIYAAWKHLGVISDDELLALREFDSPLEGHPTPRFKYNEAATGSLGQGLAVGIGMALNAKLENLNYKTYVMLGDGEIAEGSIWESAELAAHYKLDNLLAIVDCNMLGQTGETIHAHEVEKYAKKFEAFGFETFVINGHNMQEILQALQQTKTIKEKPCVIIAKTDKGHGIKNVEGKNSFHGKPFKSEEVEKLIDQLKNEFPQATEYASKPYEPENPGTNQEISHDKTSLNLEKDPNSALFNPGEKIATRKAYGYALAAAGRKNKNIIALDGDVKNSTYSEIFEEEFPERFIQCFIAEQSMLGISTGFETRNKIPFAATFAAFLTRAFDQIRMAGIGRNALRLCGSHSGVSIGEDGPSQMGMEDLAMMRTLPNSIVFYPCDGVSTYKLVELMANYNDGISYLRTTRPTTSIIYDKNEKFEIGGCKVLKQSNNDKACIIGAGITLHEALKAYDMLKNQNISVSIIDLYCVKPLDVQTLKNIAKKSDNTIITVEDHYLEGGLGQAVASALVNENIDVYNLAVTKLPRSGTSEELMRFVKIDAQSIVEKVMQI